MFFIVIHWINLGIIKTLLSVLYSAVMHWILVIKTFLRVLHSYTLNQSWYNKNLVKCSVLCCYALNLAHKIKPSWVFFAVIHWINLGIIKTLSSVLCSAIIHWILVIKTFLSVLHSYTLNKSWYKKTFWVLCVPDNKSWCNEDLTECSAVMNT